MSTLLAHALPTTTVIAAFQQKLSAAKKLTFRIDFEPEKILTKIFTPAESKLLQAHCEQHKLDMSQKHLAETLDAVSAYLSKIPILIITLAAKPTDSMIETLSELLHGQLQKSLTFNFTIDPSIIAGARLEYQGKTQSHTLATIIEKVFYEK